MNQIPYIGKFLDYGLLGSLFALSLVVIWKLYQTNQKLEDEKDAVIEDSQQHVSLVLGHMDDTLKAVLITLEKKLDNS